MAVRLSTGLVNNVMAVASFKTSFESGAGFVIDIYSGSQPATADAAPTGTKLVVISNNGAGTTVTFASPAVSGVLSKTVSETWTGTAIATGTAGWFRVRRTVDGAGVSTTDIRYDGAIATSGAQLNLASLSITSGAPVTIPSAAFTCPMSA